MHLNVNLLIVDDDDTALLIAKKFLEKEKGFTIYTADCVKEGLKIINRVRIDAIISDYQMDEHTGLDFLRMLRNTESKIPVIIFTAHSREQVAIEALNLGADYYVKKEGNIKTQFLELAHLVRTAVSHRRAEIQLKRAHDELERRVTKRTQELVKANRQLQQEIEERVKTEKVLEESLDKIKEKDLLLSTIFSTTPDLIFVKDSDHRYVIVNKAYADFYRKKPHQIIGRTFEELGEKFRTKSEVERIKKQDLEVLEKKLPIYIAEQKVTSPSGSIRYFQTTKYPISTADYPEAILGISVDVTESKIAADIISRRLKYEKTISQCSKHLLTSNHTGMTPIERSIDLLIYAIGVERGYLFLFDPSSNNATLEIEVLKDKALAWTTVLDQPVILTKSHMKKWIQHLSKGSLVAGSIRELDRKERALFTPVEGGYFILLPIFINQEVGGILGLDTRSERNWSDSDIRMLRTITEMIGSFLENQVATEALKHNEEKYRRLHDTMKQGVVYYNSDHQIISVNQAALDILGVNEDSILGKEGSKINFEFVDREGNPLPYENRTFYEAFTTGKTVKNRIVGFRTEKGIKWLSVTSVPLFNGESTKPYQVHSIFEDITEQKRSISVRREREAFRIMMESYGATDNLEDLCQKILQKLTHLLDFDSGIVRLNIDEDKIMHPVAVSGNHPGVSKITEIIEKSKCLDKLQFKDAHESIYISDITNDEIPHDTHLKQLLKEGAYFGYSLYNSVDELIGYFALTSKKTKPSTTDEKHSLETIAQMLQTIIEKRLADHQISQNVETLQAIQKSLKQERDYLSTLHDALPDVVFTVRFPNFEIEYSNSRVLGTFGYHPQEVIGQHQRILFANGEDAKRFEKFTENANLYNGMSISSEELMVSKDGTIFPVEIIITVIEKNSVISKLVYIVRDITDKKRVEKLEKVQIDLGIALAGSISLDEAFKQFTQAAIEVAHMDHGGIYILKESKGLELSYQEGLPSFFIENASSFPSTSKQYEIVMQGLPVYSNLTEISIKLDEIRKKAKIKATAVVPIVHINEILGCLVTGSTKIDNIPIQSQDALEAIATLAGIVIARVESETRIRQSEDMFRKAFDSIPEPAYLWEKIHDSKIILRMVNKTVMDESNGEMKSMIGHDIEEIYPNMPELLEAINHTLSTGENVRGEMPFDSKYGNLDGWYIWSFAEPVDNLVLMILTDITSHKLTQKVLSRQRAELSEFAHQMNHDLRNPLHNILGYVELLEDEYSEKYLSRIKLMVRTMESLLQKSVKLADAGEVIGKETITSLEEIVKISAQGIVPENIDIVIGELPNVLCDKEKVIQIIQNILRNAVEHGEPTEITFISKEKESGVDILIQNNGHPISEDIADKLFLERVTTKKDGGFGLSIVKKLIEAHEWSITLDDSKYPSFRISIPKDSISV
ncbi:MAG: PAS domain S-box protein [Candidatus Lokiarchaeota archaeon]|nr:PAS domain S-box protein [Candidatus Lokiarchaeota archaeon]